jgi:hypothetical protein
MFTAEQKEPRYIPNFFKILQGKPPKEENISISCPAARRTEIKTNSLPNNFNHLAMLVSHHNILGVLRYSILENSK